MSGAANNPYLESRDDLLRIMTSPQRWGTQRCVSRQISWHERDGSTVCCYCGWHIR